MKYVLPICLVLLTGCASEPIKLIAPEHKVVKIPQDFYNCPVMKTFPRSDTLTNQQVGSLLLKLQQNNAVCKNSLDQIQQYMEEAEKAIQKK